MSRRAPLSVPISTATPPDVITVGDMAVRQREDSLAAVWVRIRGLSTHGKLEQALQLAEQVIAETTDPSHVAQSLIARATLLFNTGRRDAVPPLLQQIEGQLDIAPHPRLLGQYHVLAADVAHDRRSYAVALLHVINADRALQRMDEHTEAAFDAWHDLTGAYTQLGLHHRAVKAGEQAQALAGHLDRPPTVDATSVAHVHSGVYRDQRGDTHGCVRELTHVVERLRPDLVDLTLIDRVVIGYAVRRLAALHHPIDVHVPPERDVGPILKQVNTLGEVCDALATRRPDQALALLDVAAGPLDALGVAEPLRLRSLALAQLGDHAGALAAERLVLLLASEQERELQLLLTDSAGARIDQDQLRRSAERHARAALTDPLTGLPNRRKFDEFTQTLIAAGKAAVIGMLDVDGLKEINDKHGHPTGDIVLQRIAGILVREARRSDLVARHGGDEFAVVLPDATRSDAESLGERIEAAVQNEAWSRLIPETPVGLSAGWAELRTDIDAAVRSADTALYETKRRHHSGTQD